MKNIFRFLQDDSGATAIEYGLLAALIGIAIIGTVTQVGSSLVARFGDVQQALDDAAPAPAPAP